VTLATDEILLALVEPSRLLGVTYLAVDERLSHVTQEAAAVPHKVRADPEQIIAVQPDLVFVASYLRGEFIRLLQAAGLVLFQFQEHEESMIRESLFWLMGGLEASTWEHVRLTTPVVLLGVTILLCFSGGRRWPGARGPECGHDPARVSSAGPVLPGSGT
jgi:hypothetical protein